MMHEISDKDFEKMINRAMDELPREYIKGLQNVVVTYDDKPDEHQRLKLKLRCHESLFGLYEGIPRTKRMNNYNLVLPDKITLFKHPMAGMSRTEDELYRQVKHTLWHEIAHHYGLDHDRIHELETNRH